MQNPKLDDVAELAGVSKTTVSRVLNNRGYLSEKTVKKVRDAVKTLNYQPNDVARQLFSKETKLIGLIFPTIANPFFGQLAYQLETQLFNKGYKVLIGNSKNDPEKEVSYLRKLMANQVDGLIVGAHNEDIEEYHNTNLPIVAIDRIMNGDIPVVSSDNYKGGKMATELLLEHGATSIVHTNGPYDLETPARDRRRAYEQIMSEHGLPAVTYTIDFNWTEAEKTKVIKGIFEDLKRVDGIFASNDTDASLIIKIAREYGKRVPEDLLVVGYDGTDVVRLFKPELTTIVQPIELMANTAVDILMKKIEGKETPMQVVLPVQLYKGETA
ncbi:LacI family DNA-binding transcriptional regulator [Dellaglioa algida]|uniref:LacI family transcriptional regulator n=1 Tax=Dellaglioa algida TaxID=105612 RepID=A0A2C8EQ89_9LACO|nr:LacI family DNA-binding transcriptional regulator [Dellaglioa algida]MDK1716102.1 LacI family DNA-binding transcriptional regulator [Dellaglioa algida]MDK1717795.1 LacI family DNA-binding transcriptional regulator [Dellaglioa algida]MDK1719383.1 LacI family DNA-binding transcriptional regulator [Dellaglioa algida]MDK1721115.1 LacI family DNA-binding transcriptional regulator [Dellaglioa algida]MDK1722726.1 LacI family DNA-binding transcriptional regulator [Dellaglioa algida]